MASADETLKKLKNEAHDALRKAEKAYYDYANACWHLDDRARALDIYENIRNATRIK